MMKQHFDQDWLNWIDANLARECDKNGIFKILLDNEFDYHTIAAKLNYHPTTNPYLFENPLTGTQQPQTQDTLPRAAGDISGAALERALYLPNAKRLDDERLELYLVDDFLTAEECTQIIAAMRTQLTSSTLTNDLEPDQYYRTSKTCNLGASTDPFIHEIDQRICRYLGIDIAFSESMQGQYYDVGEEFKAHTDYFEACDWETHCAVQGQRTYTFMIYLNDTEAGGETTFTHLEKTFHPKQGTAVIWNSLNPDGSVNPDSMHWGKPVSKGYKAIITKWFRSCTPDGSKTGIQTKVANEYIPHYTKIGFEKRQLPEPLFLKIKAFYEQNKMMPESESIPGDFVYKAGVQTFQPSSELVSLSSALRDEIHDTLKALLEQWSNTILEPTYVYGIRVYLDQAVLKTHRDRLDTHIISAIINVDQEVQEDWPLLIEDNYYRPHQVILKPGEVVFYEGARLTHGRPTPLQGNSFANIFTHFKPASPHSDSTKAVMGNITPLANSPN